MSFVREAFGVSIFRVMWPTARLQVEARPATRRNTDALREGVDKEDAFGGSSTKYDACGEMTVKYGGRHRRLAEDVAPVAQLTSMGPPSQEVKTVTSSTGEAEKNGLEFENTSHFKFDRPAVQVASAGAI